MRRTLFPLALLALIPAALAAQLPLPPLPPDPLELVRSFLKVEPAKLEALRPQAKLPDVDLPNALWIAKQAGISPEVVLQARLQGLPWIDIFIKFKVPVERVIVATERAQCPPYGKAWGFRKKHGRAPVPAAAIEMKLTDGEISEFIQLRATAGYYGTTPELLAERRCAGKSVRDLIDEEHGKKHGKGKPGGSSPAGKGKGRGGKGKG